MVFSHTQNKSSKHQIKPQSLSVLLLRVTSRHFHYEPRNLKQLSLNLNVRAPTADHGWDKWTLTLPLQDILQGLWLCMNCHPIRFLFIFTSVYPYSVPTIKVLSQCPIDLLYMNQSVTGKFGRFCVDIMVYIQMKVPLILSCCFSLFVNGP